MISCLGGTLVHWDHLSTAAGAAGVGLKVFGVAGCSAGVAGAVGRGFSSSMDGLSGVAGDVDATPSAVVCNIVAGVEVFNSSVSSAG